MEAVPVSVRVDVWLDVACLFKTRSEAQRACRAGKVEVSGEKTKPHRLVKVGDEIRITRGPGKQTVVVRALAERHLPRAEARTLYEDRTPVPSAEELEMRRLERTFWSTRPASTGAPDKRQRRALRRLKGRE